MLSHCPMIIQMIISILLGKFLYIPWVFTQSCLQTSCYPRNIPLCSIDIPSASNLTSIPSCWETSFISISCHLPSPTWGFPKTRGYPLSSIHFRLIFFPKNHPAMGVPPLMGTSPPPPEVRQDGLRSTGPAGGHGAADRVHRQGRHCLHAAGAQHGGHGRQSQQGLLGHAP